MNTDQLNKLTTLVISHNQAGDHLTKTKEKYFKELTILNHRLMREAHDHYHSFKYLIYTHETTLELMIIIKECETPLIINEFDNHLLWLYESKSGMPYLRVVKIVE